MTTTKTTKTKFCLICLVVFYGISTFVGYLMLDPVYTYVYYIPTLGLAEFVGNIIFK